eukprot:4984935-Ditylum_brightwellii.AAC.1
MAQSIFFLLLMAVKVLSVDEKGFFRKRSTTADPICFPPALSQLAMHPLAGVIALLSVKTVLFSAITRLVCNRR